MKVLKSKARSRPWFLVGGLLVLAVAAVPAWQQLRIYSSLERSRQALRQGDFTGAIETLQQLDESLGHRAEVNYLLGVAHRRLGKIDQAFPFLQQAEELGWPADELTCQRYMARFQSGDIAGTRAYLQQLIVGGAHDELAEQVYEALAKGFLAEFRMNDAAVVLDHWIAWKPDAIQPRRWRAEVLEQDHRWLAAAEHYREIVKRSPTDLIARLHLAGALMADQHIDEARDEFTAAQALFPNDLRPVLGIAQCERRLGNTDAAKQALERIVAAKTADEIRSIAWCELGQLATEASDYSRATECFQHALKDDPNFAQAHHLLGTAYSRLGRDAEAKSHLSQAEAILDRSGKLRDLSLDVTNDPANIKARLQIATILREMGHTEESIRWFLTVVHLDPGHREARLALAEFFEAQGEHELAAGHRRAVNRLRPANDAQSHALQE